MIRSVQELQDYVTHICLYLQITVEDIKHMKKQTLYKFGVGSFEDAEIILQHAKQGNDFRPRSLSENSKSKFE